MQISHEIFSRKFPSSLLIFRKRLFKNENLGDYFRNFMVSPSHNHRLSLSSSLSSSSSSLGKRHLNSEFPLLQTLSRLFHLVQFVKCWYFFLELTKREIRYFHVAVVRWRKRNVQKSVIYVHSCCFANLNLLLFCRSRWRHHCLFVVVVVIFVVIVIGVGVAIVIVVIIAVVVMIFISVITMLSSLPSLCLLYQM